MGLTEREEELRLAIANAMMEKRGTTILFDFGEDLIEILKANQNLIFNVFYEERQRRVEELQASPWIGFERSHSGNTWVKT